MDEQVQVNEMSENGAECEKIKNVNRLTSSRASHNT